MNAVLNIKNEKQFSCDIWQYETDWTDEQWKEAIISFADTINHAKETLDRLAYEDKQDDFLDDELYILGDVINFLNSIDVRKEKK